MTQTVAQAKAEQLRIFGPVWDGAGIRGFAMEGYWYHAWVPRLSFEGSTFVAKTVTTYSNKGNMRLTESHTPAARFPSCILTYLTKGMVLNAVGLSNPGGNTFLRRNSWLSIVEPFLISYMPVLPEEDSRAGWEVRDFINDVRKMLLFKRFATSHLGIQLNISCPNVGADLTAMTKKTHALLDQFESLGLPVVVKLNLLVEPRTAAEIAKHPACTGLCVANSIPFGTVLPKEWWEKYFLLESPLAVRGFGSGGLSGKPLLRLVESWLRIFREMDPDTYVNAGGGILRASDVNVLHDAGANSVFFASAAILRPWRVPGIIRRAHELF